MKDNRAIKEDLLEQLSENGGFYEFVIFVKNNPEKSILCFRGNSESGKGNVTIYYRNHMIWELSKTKRHLKVKISFNHARYTEDWRAKLKILFDDFGFRKSSDINKGKDEKLECLINEFEKNNNNTFKGYLYSICDINNKFDRDFVENSFEILKQLNDDFFKPENEIDYFKSHPGEEVNHREYLEKIVQQELYKNHSWKENGIFIYDLEFSQTRNKKIEGMSDDIIKKLKVDANEPDMLGIEFENGKPKFLVLIEVKSKKTSLAGKSGLKVHMDKMENYINKKEFKFLVENRIKEAKDILRQYNSLELRNVPNNIDIPNNIPIKIEAILTHKAKDNKIKLEGYESKNAVEKIEGKNEEIIILSKILRR